MGKAWFAALTVAVLGLSWGCGGGGGGSDRAATMVGAWQPISATMDGAPAKVAAVMPDTSPVAARWSMVFWEDGTCTFTAYGARGATIETLSGAWSVNDRIAQVSIPGSSLSVHWSDAGNVRTVGYTLDGKTVTARWVRTAPAPSGHDPAWVGTWQAQSLLVNGVNTPLGTWFQWDPGSDSEQLELQASGVSIVKEMAAGSVHDSVSGTWAIDNGVLTWSYGGVTSWGYWDGQLLSFVMLNPLNGDSVTITWTKLS